MIELSLTEVAFLFESLGDPNKWKADIENGVLKNGFDDSTDCHLIMGTKTFAFKIRHIGKYAVEWRPKEKIVIKNSDEEDFSEGKLIAAFDKDHNRII